MRSFLFPLAALALTGCGYVASPLAPLANVPARIADLAAIQRGGKVIIQFTVPRLTTEGVEIKPPLTFDLSVGPVPNPWNESQWAADAKQIPESAASPSAPPPGALVHYEIPAAEWIGKEVAIAAQTVGDNGKAAGWSNVANVTVIPPPDRPTILAVQVTAAGLHLAWRARGEHFRVLRAAGTSDHYDVVATVTEPEWTDPSVQFGTPYRYIVQTFVPQTGNREAQSDLSEPYPIIPEPTAPTAPKGLRAVPAPNSIELSWDGNPEPDVVGYRVYRGAPGATLEKIGETGPIPSYSDRSAQHANNYRYAVTAVSRSGKESPQSLPADIGYP